MNILSPLTGKELEEVRKRSDAFLRKREQARFTRCATCGKPYAARMARGLPFCNRVCQMMFDGAQL